MRNTTPASNAAVEPFSGAIRTKTIPIIHIMYLKALGLAPSSSWNLDRMNAVTMITAILANSDGWN